MSVAVSEEGRKAFLNKLVEDFERTNPFAPYERLNTTVPTFDAKLLALVNSGSPQKEVGEDKCTSQTNDSKQGESSKCIGQVIPPIELLDGRIRCGESIIFPNKFPFGLNHAVTVMSTAHYIPIEKFELQHIRDAIRVSVEYIRAIVKLNTETPALWPVLVWNYMPPSAGSIIHPHMQVFVEDMPSPQLAHIIKCGQNWKQSPKQHALAMVNAIKAQNGFVAAAAAGFLSSGTREAKSEEATTIPFHQALIVQEERAGVRFIGRHGCVVALAPFASRGTNEVHLLLPGLSSLVDLADTHITELAHAINAVLHGYNKIGVGSFNMISLSASTSPTESERSSHTLHFKLISRPYPDGLYTNDSGPTERMFDVFVINSLPEKYAPSLKEAWDEYFK